MIALWCYGLTFSNHGWLSVSYNMPEAQEGSSTLQPLRTVGEAEGLLLRQRWGSNWNDIALRPRFRDQTWLFQRFDLLQIKKNCSIILSFGTQVKLNSGIEMPTYGLGWVDKLIIEILTIEVEIFTCIDHKYYNGCFLTDLYIYITHGAS